MKYKKYFRKTSLKQKNIGDLFLDIIQKKNPKTFLEIGVFHGVTARNVCELMFKNHGDNFNYIGIDIFDDSDNYKNEVVPSKTFNNPIKTLKITEEKYKSFEVNKIKIGNSSLLSKINCFYFIQATRKDVDRLEVEYEN